MQSKFKKTLLFVISSNVVLYDLSECKIKYLKIYIIFNKINLSEISKIILPFILFYILTGNKITLTNITTVK